MSGMTTLAEEDRPIPAPHDFSVGDIVLAFHGNLLYEARVLSIEREGDARAHAYTVHFQGWKKSWDERVSTKFVFQHNDDNLRIAHRLLNGAKMRQQALQPAGCEKGVKDDKEQEDEQEQHEKSFPQSSPASSLFQIAPALQRQLVDDWEFVTKERRLVPLPRELTVQDLLLKWVAGRRQSSDKATREVAEALQTYFDAALPRLLLYRFERQQYDDISQKQSPMVPSAVYGPEHFLRLLVKLPYLLEGTAIEADKLQGIADKVNELAKYMQKNGRVFFLSEYESAPESYLKSAAEQE